MPGGCRDRLQPHRVPGAAVFDGPAEALRPLLEVFPARIQDPTAAAAVEATAGLAPRLIADFCAGRGTKTVQLAARHPEARIIATDVDDARRSSLARRCADLANVEVIEPKALRDHTGLVDLLVVDAPCSNTGVLARRPEARERATNATIQTLRDLQRQVIADALPLLKECGVLLYSTCSVESEENEVQSTWLRKWHPFTLVQEQATMPRGLPGEEPIDYQDGGYFALLRRSK